MGAINGDDGQWELGGYGVLGTATPRTAPTQDGPEDVDSFGVWGILGTPQDVGNLLDEVTNNTGGFRAAILARNTLPDQGFAIYAESRPDLAPPASFGFIGGRSPYAGEATGVFGQATQRGVIGVATDPQGIGVYGGGNNAEGFLSGKNPFAADQAVGVYGRSAGLGVFGFADGSGVGVYGNTAFGAGTGVIGHTSTGVGVQGECDRDPNDPNQKGLAGKFIGNVEVTGDVRLTNGQDLAEEFELAGATEAEPGMVMVLDDSGYVRSSAVAYDRKVAGVVSGAGAYKPGLVLNKPDPVHGSAPLALAGRAYCKVTAEPGAIAIGDLLTTSDTPGHAMRADDPARAFGSVIGKALAPLREGTGLIPILISLR